jgi:hypothetical protein
VIYEYKVHRVPKELKERLLLEALEEKEALDTKEVLEQKET